jgi:hypothetical protein
MKLKYLITFVLIYGLAIFVAGCGDDTVTEDPTETGSTSTTELVEDQPDKDLSIQEYNLQKRKSMTKTRFPGDTIDLMEAVLRTYPKGSYVIEEDIPNSVGIPPAAVIYRQESAGKLVFALIATSREGQERDRLIESKNVIGYDQSFIDYDSTRLGTAMFFMTGFKNDGKVFTRLWEKYTHRHMVDSNQFQCKPGLGKTSLMPKSTFMPSSKTQLSILIISSSTALINSLICSKLMKELIKKEL